MTVLPSSRVMASIAWKVPVSELVFSNVKSAAPASNDDMLTAVD